jgi:hypothetical protein
MRDLAGLAGELMRLWQRAALMLSICPVQALYFPLNRGLHGGVMLKTPPDDFIPLWPIWVLPLRALTWVYWIGCAAWATWKMEEQLFKTFLVSLFIVIAGGLALALFGYGAGGWIASRWRPRRYPSIETAMPSPHWGP